MIPFFFVNLCEDLAENGIKLSIVFPTMQGLAVGLFRAFFLLIWAILLLVFNHLKRTHRLKPRSKSLELSRRSYLLSRLPLFPQGGPPTMFLFTKLKSFPYSRTAAQNLDKISFVPNKTARISGQDPDCSHYAS